MHHDICYNNPFVVDRLTLQILVLKIPLKWGGSHYCPASMLHENRIL